MIVAGANGWRKGRSIGGPRGAWEKAVGRLTGLVRRVSHGQQVQSSGAKAVVGDLDDATFIKTRALENDAIFHTAAADHKPSAEAVCQGAADRARRDSVPDDAPHRQIDLTILKYQKEIGDKAKIAVMIPPLPYGYNPRRRRLTIQIPTLTRFAMKHGFAGHVGKGLSVESRIHVLDLAQVFVTLLHQMEDALLQEFIDNLYFFLRKWT
ncbi:uncharacterized protein A1O5_09705 [Cladophialophora psammophila CBS 110553]|uniref:Uncharacterized protein n=1 Tax=Cladophialophora psammophila CBS 110553 TaxID=1182543 RepID=W9X9D5_9EURO|nr:uncharacterized protein A1O5_09705 [Cladophialophora psammophila CBS 110553]EXJ67059.1 hypothetical protein A1O5_09705 [Cladophialophora psammophila CBS 110553]